MLRSSQKKFELGSLITPPLLRRAFPKFERVTYESIGLSGADGINIATGVSTNTKPTSYTQLKATTTQDSDGFFFSYVGPSANADYLWDIAIGAASSEVNLVTNLLMGSGTANFPGGGYCYIPLPIPAGVRVSARCQATDASVSATVGIAGVKGGIYRYMRKRRATTYGANTADSGGVSVDPGGSVLNKGNWIEITSSTTNKIESALICIGSQNNATRTLASHLFDIGYGANPNEILLVPNLHCRQDSGIDSIVPCWFNRDFELQAGQRLVARQSCSISDATDRLADVVVIGFD